jgi:hypothetical protein
VLGSQIRVIIEEEKARGTQLREPQVMSMCLELEKIRGPSATLGMTPRKQMTQKTRPTEGR